MTTPLADHLPAAIARLEGLMAAHPSPELAAVLAHFYLATHRFWDAMRMEPLLEQARGETEIPHVLHARALIACARANAGEADSWMSRLLTRQHGRELAVRYWTARHQYGRIVSFVNSNDGAGMLKDGGSMPILSALLAARKPQEALAFVKQHDALAELLEKPIREIVPLWMDLGLFEVAEERLRSMRESGTPDDEQLANKELARICLWKLALDEATAFSEALLAQDTTSAEAFRNLGAIACLQGEYSKATRMLERALGLDPFDQEAQIWLAEVGIKTNDHERASAHLLGATRNSETFATILLQAALQARTRRWFRSFQRDAKRHRFMTGLFLGQLDPWFTQNEVERALANRGSTIRMLDRVLASLGGNRSLHLTRVTNPDEQGFRKLEKVHLPPSSRSAAALALQTIVSESPRDALRALDNVVTQFRSSSQPHCFRGELRLWLGDYDAAIHDFMQALRKDETRWAYIGLFAALMYKNQYHLARGVAQLGHARFPWGAASTGFAYRGELHRRMGRPREAIRDLTYTLEAKPTRVGGWMNLALAYWDLGNRDAALKIAQRLEVDAPALVWDAALSLRMADVGRWKDELVPVLNRALKMMRGNRSSSTITYFTRENQFRVSRPEAWSAYAKNTLDWLSRVSR